MQSLEIKKAVIKERRMGRSIEGIASDFKIPRGTVFSWVKDLTLSKKALDSLESKRKTAREKGLKSIAIKRKLEKEIIEDRVKKELQGGLIGKNAERLLCSFLYWAEGAKKHTHVTFINSDPKMIQVFLKLLRKSFDLDEGKFRILVHIHEYHDDAEVIRYWSAVTHVPITQFNNSYLKPHSGKNKREGYMGCVSIRYFDSKIAQELYCLYNTYSNLLGV